MIFKTKETHFGLKMARPGGFEPPTLGLENRLQFNYYYYLSTFKLNVRNCSLTKVHIKNLRFNYSFFN